MQGEMLAALHWGGNVLALWGAARLMGLYPGWQLLAAASAGSCAALLCGHWLLLLFLPLLMALAAWPRLSPPRLLRAWGAVILSGALLSGLCGLLWQQGVPPAWALLTASLLMALSALIFRAPAPSRCQRVLIHFQGGALRLCAMVDTGNLLTDPVTGLPVIVCSRQALSPLFPTDSWQEGGPAGFRYLSVRTCAGRGLMLIFRPQAVFLEIHGRWRLCQALIGAAPAPYDGAQALVPAALIQ